MAPKQQLETQSIKSDVEKNVDNFADAKKVLQELEKEGFDVNNIPKEELLKMQKDFDLMHTMKNAELERHNLKGTVSKNQETKETNTFAGSSLEQQLGPELLSKTEKLWGSYIETTMPEYLDTSIKKNLTEVITTGFLQKLGTKQEAEGGIVDTILAKFNFEGDSVGDLMGNMLSTMNKFPEVKTYTIKLKNLAKALQLPTDAQGKSIETSLSKQQGLNSPVLTDKNKLFAFIEQLPPEANILQALQKPLDTDIKLSEILKKIPFDDKAKATLIQFTQSGEKLFNEAQSKEQQQQQSLGMYSTIGKFVDAAGSLFGFCSPKEFLERTGLDGVFDTFLGFTGYSGGIDQLHGDRLTNKINNLGPENKAAISYAQAYITKYMAKSPIKFDASGSLLCDIGYETSLVDKSHQDTFTIEADRIDELLSANTIIPDPVVVKQVIEYADSSQLVGLITKDDNGKEIVNQDVFENKFELFKKYYLAYIVPEILRDDNTLKSLNKETLPLALVGQLADRKFLSIIKDPTSHSVFQKLAAGVVLDKTIKTKKQIPPKQRKQQEQERKQKRYEAYNYDISYDKAQLQAMDTGAQNKEAKYQQKAFFLSDDPEAQNYRRYLNSLEQQYELPPYTLSAVMKTESNGTLWRPNGEIVGSSKGAKGLFQFIDSTATGYAKMLGISSGSKLQQSPIHSAKAAAMYLKSAGKVAGENFHLRTALARYNAGQGKINKLIGKNTTVKETNKTKLPPETQKYITKIQGDIDKWTKIGEVVV